MLRKHRLRRTIYDYQVRKLRTETDQEAKASLTKAGKGLRDSGFVSNNYFC